MKTKIRGKYLLLTICLIFGLLVPFKGLEASTNIKTRIFTLEQKEAVAKEEKTVTNGQWLLYKLQFDKKIEIIEDTSKLNNQKISVEIKKIQENEYELYVPIEGNFNDGDKLVLGFDYLLDGQKYSYKADEEQAASFKTDKNLTTIIKDFVSQIFQSPNETTTAAPETTPIIDNNTKVTMEFISSGENKNVLYRDEEIQLILKTANEVTEFPKVKFGNNEAIFTLIENKDGILTYKATLKPQELNLKENDKVKVSVTGELVAKDGTVLDYNVPQNEITYGDKKVNVKETEATSKSGNQFIKDEDQLTYKVVSDKKLLIEETEIGGRTLKWKESVKGDEYTYIATIDVKKGMFKDNEVIKLANVTAKDIYESTVKLNFEKSFTYFDEIKAEVSAISSNTVKENIAIKGDKLTLQIKTNHEVNIEGDAIIAGSAQKVSFVRSDETGYYYEAVQTIDNADIEDESIIQFDLSKIRISDKAGHEAEELSVVDEIKYYAPIEIAELTVKNDNQQEDSLIVGNTLSVSFKTSHKIQMDGNVKLNNKELVFKESQKDNDYYYQTEVKIEDGTFEDLEKLQFNVDGVIVKDEYGNENIKFPEFKNTFTYYAPFNVGKNISELILETSNSGKEGNVKLIKNDDELSVSFKTNRKLSSVSGEFGSEKVDFQSEDGKCWRTSMIVKDKQFKEIMKIFSSV